VGQPRFLSANDLAPGLRSLQALLRLLDLADRSFCDETLMRSIRATFF
jgi:hypothetical protein